MGDQAMSARAEALVPAPPHPAAARNLKREYEELFHSPPPPASLPKKRQRRVSVRQKDPSRYAKQEPVNNQSALSDARPESEDDKVTLKAGFFVHPRAEVLSTSQARISRLEVDLAEALASAQTSAPTAVKAEPPAAHVPGASRMTTFVDLTMDDD